MVCTMVVFASLLAAGILFARQASLVIWAISFSLFTALVMRYGRLGWFFEFLIWILEFGIVIAAITPLRRQILSKFLFARLACAMPNMSSTEREALEVGTVGWEGELFRGNPDFSLLRAAPVVHLTAEEKAFLEGPVNELCSLLDDWDITHHRKDLSPEVWQFIKEHRFLGMMIPKDYGGLGFSVSAQMSILVKIYSCSITAGTTVAVPNSLGPGELLLKYGTEEQKKYYLPRLADGREIPCFALTAPTAGSDAASIPDVGIVCRQKWKGKLTLGVRLTWDKRYITLCPIATVIGLAFKMQDPDHYLSKKEDIGITCALIPAHTPGVIKGRRHFPLNSGFLNGPTQGKDVFVPMDYLIGGEKMAGQGWRMLMECLSAGRAISLPSSANGSVQALALATGAYARIRKQFNQPIGVFEGIEEPLARIAGHAYLIDAALTMTAAAIDQGEKPSVAGAILKYQTTERARLMACDAMDVHGGKGICLGPNNYLGRGYQGAPIGITVEGANILTRSLIIFGQGVIRCHPYVYQELESLRSGDLIQFDKVFFAHLGFIAANATKSLLFSWTDAWMTKAPVSLAKRYYQLIQLYSTYFAFLTDFSLTLIGGELKRKEKLSARLGDMLSSLYLACAVLKRFHEEGELEVDLPLVDWSCQQLLHECEVAMQGVIRNFPSLWARMFLVFLLQPLGSRRHKPRDALGHQLAKILLEPNETRTRLTRLAYSEPGARCPIGRLEEAFHKIYAVEPLEKKVLSALKSGLLKTLTFYAQIEEALELDLLTALEAQQLKEAELARQEIIKVDDFSEEELCR